MTHFAAIFRVLRRLVRSKAKTQNTNFFKQNYGIKEEKHSIWSAFRNWWEVVDSNHRSHRRQIYSLFPLATRETSHMQLRFEIWSW